MSTISTFSSLLGRLNAVAKMLNIAARLLPYVSSQDSASVISQQIADLRAEVARQIAAAEQSMEHIEDKIQTIAQFLLLNRTKIDPADASELEQLLAEVRRPQ
ncbi:MAG: hypothetical protein ABIZ04_17005 [Opitutus sp.]